MRASSGVEGKPPVSVGGRGGGAAAAARGRAHALPTLSVRAAARCRSRPRCGQLRHAGERREGAQGRAHGEAQRRLAPAVEEEALRAHGRGAAAAPPEAARPPAAAAAAAATAAAQGARLQQGQGVALLQHEDRGLRGKEGQVRVLHRGHVGGQGDRLQVPAGRGLERRDHAAHGAVQEPAGDPSRALHAPEAAAPRGAAPGPPDSSSRRERARAALSCASEGAREPHRPG